MNFYDFFTTRYFWKNDDGATIFSHGLLKDRYYLINDSSQQDRLKKIITAIYAIMFLPIIAMHSSEFILLYLIWTGVASYFIINHEVKKLPTQNLTYDDRIKSVTVKQSRFNVKMLLAVMLLLVACIFSTNSMHTNLPTYNKTILLIIILMIATIVGIVRNVHVLYRKSQIENNNQS